MRREKQFQFVEFKLYAQFILKDQGLQSELAVAFLEQIRNSHFPSMHFLLRLPSSQSQAVIRKNFQDLLEKSLNDTAFESALAKINNQNDRNSSVRSRRDTGNQDLLRIFGIQKQLFVNFLDRFTQDFIIFSNIVHELEDFQSLLEEQCFNAANLLDAERITSLLQGEKGETYLRPLLDGLPLKVGYFRSDKTVGFVNTAYADFFNLKKEEVEGKTIEQVFRESGFVDQDVYLERALNGELLKYSFESDVSGSKRWFVNTLIPKKLIDSVDGAFFIAEEITEFKAIRREAEDELTQLKDEVRELKEKNISLQKTKDELENFVYTAAHDLRTPVFSLDGLLEILRERFIGKADTEETRMLEMTGLATGRLKKTIEDLLEVVKAQKEVHGKTVEKKAVRIKEVAEEVKEDLHSLIVENIALIVEDFKVEEVYCRTANLRSIIYNLLSNAVKYGSPERPLLIEMTSYQEGDYVVLSVKDNGLGMSADQLANLFSMYNRMHPQVEGIGIGLYSIKKMVENIGGKIDVKSEEGIGSEFLVYFPN